MEAIEADPAMFNKKIQVAQTINNVRAQYPNLATSQNCDMATDYLYPHVQKIYPDVRKQTLLPLKPGSDVDNAGSHVMLLANNGQVVIDSQLKQFQDVLQLPPEFVEKGVYDIAEYKQFIRDYYNNI